MGIVASCQKDARKDLLFAIREGDLEHVKLLLGNKPTLVNGVLFGRALSPLHYAASHGQAEVLSLLLRNGAIVDALNRYKQTPLMLACKNGRVSCIEHLIECGANILMFDTSRERTCLHYAAKSGHQCFERILTAAQSPPVAETWGFARFINVRDGSGETPLHLAARSRHAAVVHLLLSNGALVGAMTTKSGRSSLGPGSMPLHFAARGGSTECVKELLAWGADRLHRNSQGHTPFFIALKYRNKACAALLNPLSAEPLVWPSPLKFMSSLDPEAKVLLEAALAQANNAWERRIFCTSENVEACPLEGPGLIKQMEDEQEESEMCCICFERACTIEVQHCAHQMCAECTLALCCHNKPNPAMTSLLALACPFCRRNIEHLKRVQPKLLQVAAVEEEQVEASRDEDRDLSNISAANYWKKSVDSGSSSTIFMGMVTKGSFRLLSSSRGGRVVDMDWHKESSYE